MIYREERRPDQLVVQLGEGDVTITPALGLGESEAGDIEGGIIMFRNQPKGRIGEIIPATKGAADPETAPLIIACTSVESADVLIWAVTTMKQQMLDRAEELRREKMRYKISLPRQPYSRTGKVVLGNLSFSQAEDILDILNEGEDGPHFIEEEDK